MQCNTANPSMLFLLYADQRNITHTPMQIFQKMKARHGAFKSYLNSFDRHCGQSIQFRSDSNHV